jgi:hypothetical protein
MVVPSGLHPIPLEIAVEHARPRGFVVGHRPGPEAPLRITDPVVHPNVRATGLRLGELDDRARRSDKQEPGACSQDITTPGGRRCRPDGAIELDRRSFAELTAGTDARPVQPLSDDVDPEQLVAFAVPTRALAEHPGLGRAGFGR